MAAEKIKNKVKQDSSSETGKSLRDIKKAKNRTKLINAALKIVEEKGGLDQASIREITKRAGLSPNAFYHHFKSVEEIGMELINQAGLALRQMMREARLANYENKNLIRSSLENYVSFIEKNKGLFLFALRSRIGGNQIIRLAIRNELRFLSYELSNDIDFTKLNPNIKRKDLEILVESYMTTMTFGTADLLANHIRPEEREEILSRVEKQLIGVALAMINWRS
jgi:AcrR family transcriptional regulator